MRVISLVDVEIEDHWAKRAGWYKCGLTDETETLGFKSENDRHEWTKWRVSVESSEVYLLPIKV